MDGIIDRHGVEWARTAVAGDYLITYDESGLTHEQDPKSLCGYCETELHEIERVLRARDLILDTDDRGLIVKVRWLDSVERS